MSAPTSGSADGSSIPGYYPDPSIPDYIRYWDGAAWVPGTSRPAPAEGEPLPAPPPGLAAVPPGAHPEPAVPPVVRPESAVPAVVHPEPEPSSVRTQITAAVPDETGPMFLDEPPAGEVPPAAVPGPRPGGNAAPEPRPGEGPGPTAARPAADDPRRPHGTRPEPATAWQADAARQSGFGGERDRRVSWGSGTGPTVPLPDPRGGESQAAGPAADRAPDGAAADRAGTEDRAAAAAGSGAAGGAAPAGTPQAGAPGRPGGEGTLTLRAVRPGSAPGTPAPDRNTVTIRAVGDAPGAPAPAAAGPAIPGPAAPAPAAAGPAAPGPGGPAAAPSGALAASAPSGPSGTAAPVPAGPAAPGPAVPGPAAGVPAQGGPSGAPAQGWAQQVQQLARPGGDGPAVAPAPGAPAGPGAGGLPPEGVIPWKPPVDNPFLQAARAQGRPATLGRRLAARLIDSVLLAAVVGAAAVPLWTRAEDHIDAKIEEAKLTGETVTVYLLDGTTGTYLGIVLGVLLVAGLLYEALPTAKWGRTLGKKLCGLRTLDIESHDTPTFGSALRRWLVYGVLGVLVIGVVNVVWCLFDRPWRQCWHDKAAHTFVATGG